MRLPDFTPARQFVSAERDFPVYTAAEGGPGENHPLADPVDWVPRPEPVARVKDAYGLNIVGESMAPGIRAWRCRFGESGAAADRQHHLIFYAELHRRAARATIKRLRRASTESWLVRQWNPPDGQEAGFRPQPA